MRSSLKHSRSPSYNFWTAFIFVFVIMVTLFVKIQVWPFGNNMILKADSIHQYFPFYQELQRKLSSGESPLYSLLYSFSGGFGYNFWTTISYYLACPLNLILRFIPSEYVGDFMDYMILLKIALSSGTFGYYLSKHNPEAVKIQLPLSIAYGLNAYMIGYGYNIMWLDSVMVLPLVMYGLELISKGKKGRVYCLSLMYAIWCNYYIGFMLCIFSVLYFAALEIIKEWEGIKVLFRDVFKFGICSLIAGGACAVLIIPTYKGLMLSSSTEIGASPHNVLFLDSIWNVLDSFLITREPLIVPNSQAGLNIYCGMLPMACLLLYALDSKIKIRERIVKYAISLFIFSSFIISSLNFMWHGFHLQHGIPNRFSFILIAMMLMMTFEVFPDIHLMKTWKIAIAFLGPIIYYMIRMILNKDGVRKEYIYGCVFLALYYFMFVIWKFSGKSKLFLNLISYVMIIEITLNTAVTYSMIGRTERDYYNQTQKDFAELMEVTGEEDDNFRSEIDSNHMRNITIASGGKGIVIFNSMMYKSITDLCDSVGIESRPNKNGYLGCTRFMNDVFGIKYVASPVGKTSTLNGMAKIYEGEKLDLYKNENALSIGFLVNEDILKWDPSKDKTVFQNQNDFITLATGKDGIYELLDTIDLKNEITREFPVEKNLQYYFKLRQNVDILKVDAPEYKQELKPYNDFIVPVITSESGKSAMIEYTSDSEKMTSIDEYVCSNEEYQDVIDELKKNQLTVTKMDGASFEGTIDSSSSGILLLTIPYDDGWKIKMDGDNIEAKKIGNVFIGIPLEKGDHTISMRYIPDGLIPGSIISASFILMLCIMMLLEKKPKKLI